MKYQSYNVRDKPIRRDLFNSAVVRTIVGTYTTFGKPKESVYAN